MFCNKCGAENAGQSRFCASCGAPLSSSNEQVSSERESNLASSKTEDMQEYYEAAIGYKNTDYYSSRFTRFDSEGSGVSWNWPAFFISSYWLVYRKMWAWALLYFLSSPLIIIIAILSSVSEVAVVLVLLVVPLAYLIAIFVLFPMYANAIYYRHVKTKIQKAKKYSSDREKRLRMLTATGGTSWVAVIIIFLFPLFLFFIGGILAGIAIPAYQDYTLRAKVVEGLSLGEEYKRKVETYASQYHQLPSSNADIGIAQQVNTANVASVSVGKNGVVVITYANDPQLNGKSVALVPSINDENYIVWECRGIDMENKFLPSACRKIPDGSARPSAGELARLATEQQARIATEQQARIATEQQARIATEQQARIVTEQQARIVTEQVNLAAEKTARHAAEQNAQLLAEQQTRLLAEQEARIAEEHQARQAAAEQQARAAEVQAVRILEEQKVKQASLEAQNVVQAYYQDLHNNNCWSAQLKRLSSPAKLCDLIKRVEWFRVNALAPLGASPSEAVIGVDVTGKNHGEQPRRWIGQFVLKRIDGNWKIVTMNLDEVK